MATDYTRDLTHNSKPKSKDYTKNLAGKVVHNTNNSKGTGGKDYVLGTTQGSTSFTGLNDAGDFFNEVNGGLATPNFTKNDNNVKENGDLKLARTHISDIKDSVGMYKNIDLYNNIYRFGYFNFRSTLSTTREYLFFTKPDLHLSEIDDISGKLKDPSLLHPSLKNISYFDRMWRDNKRIFEQLQYSLNTDSGFFNNLLFNQVISNLEIPGLEATAIETASNRYGVNLSYRGTSESSNDNFDFSLEFKDTKWLDVYHFFKIYEEYETLKHHGVIRPYLKYIENKNLHDVFSIYKFLVDEDGETLIYWCKFYGVMPKNLPRDTFSSSTFDSGLSYSINFRAAFFEDMDPQILVDFNKLYEKQWETLAGDGYGRNVKASGSDIDSNYRICKAAHVFRVDENNNKDFPGNITRKDESGTDRGRYVLRFN